MYRWQRVTTPDNVVATTAFLADDVAAYVLCLTTVTAALAVALTWSQMKDLPQKVLFVPEADSL